MSFFFCSISTYLFSTYLVAIPLGILIIMGNQISAKGTDNVKNAREGKVLSDEGTEYSVGAKLSFNNKPGTKKYSSSNMLINSSSSDEKSQPSDSPCFTNKDASNYFFPKIPLAAIHGPLHAQGF